MTMNRLQLDIVRQRDKRQREAICRLAVKLESHSLSYTPELSKVLKRSELDAVQRYVSNHALYPDMNGGWDDLLEAEDEKKD